MTDKPASTASSGTASTGKGVAGPGASGEMAAEPDISYEEARDELVAVVQRLEAGGVPLQESVDLWERGEQLAAICQRWLDGARARLDAVRDEARRGD
jgi:exodeoxyribonuclease VII small subunit